MRTGDLVAQLEEAGVSVVIIGGVALRLYDSPRVTQDLDLAVRTLDVDTVLEKMYDLGYALVTRVDKAVAHLAPTCAAAERWVNRANPGSLSFVAAPPELRSRLESEAAEDSLAVEHSSIHIESQVDFIYEPPVPFPRLKARAKTVDLGGSGALVAAPEDLIALKEARSDRTSDDDSDISYLRKLLADGTAGD